MQQHHHREQVQGARRQQHRQQHRRLQRHHLRIGHLRVATVKIRIPPGGLQVTQLLGTETDRREELLHGIKGNGLDATEPWQAQNDPRNQEHACRCAPRPLPAAAFNRCRVVLHSLLLWRTNKNAGS